MFYLDFGVDRPYSLRGEDIALIGKHLLLQTGDFDISVPTADGVLRVSYEDTFDETVAQNVLVEHHGMQDRRAYWVRLSQAQEASRTALAAIRKEGEKEWVTPLSQR